MNTYYECHLTMTGKPEYVRPRVESMKWKFSAIDGDITLGDGVKLYATRHFNGKLAPHEVLQKLNDAAKMMQILGVRVIRKKAELVIYDDRSSKIDACNGGCIECHLDDFAGQDRSDQSPQ